MARKQGLRDHQPPRVAPRRAVALEAPRERRGIRVPRKVVAAVVVLLLVIAWQSGSFDQVLAPMGLNAKSCIRNGYGATFCGSQAESYCATTPGAWGSDACSDLDPDRALTWQLNHVGGQ